MPRVLGTAARREASHAGSWYDDDGAKREGEEERRVERKMKKSKTGIEKNLNLSNLDLKKKYSTLNSTPSGTASVLKSKIDAWLDDAHEISSDDPGQGHTRALIGP